MANAVGASEGMLSRFFNKKNKKRMNNIELPNHTGPVDPRIVAFKKRKGVFQPNTRAGKTAEKVQGGLSIFKKMRDKADANK